MSFAIEGETGEWEVVIGLEVHAQVTSRAKLFSGAATAFGVVGLVERIEGGEALFGVRVD